MNQSNGRVKHRRKRVHNRNVVLEPVWDFSFPPPEDVPYDRYEGINPPEPDGQVVPKEDKLRDLSTETQDGESGSRFTSGSLFTPPSALTIGLTSSAGNIIVNWTPGTGYAQEIWRNQGSGFFLLSTLSGTANTFTDATGIAANQLWTYKVRAKVVGSLFSSFTNTASIANTLTAQTGAVSFPDLILWLGDMNWSPSTTTSFSAPLLAQVGGQISFFGNTVLTSFSAPSLTTNGSLFISFGTCTALATLTLTALTTCVGILDLHSCALTSVTLSNLTSISSDCDMHGNTGLTTTSLPVLIFASNHTFNFSGCALVAASINQILARGVASGPTTGSTYTLNGGTNAAPTGQGINDKATLIAAPNTVTTN